MEHYHQNKKDFFFYGLLIYVCLFYSQIAGRFTVLAPFRLEFVLGSILIIFSVIRVLTNQAIFRENKLNFAIVSLFLFILSPIRFINNESYECKCKNI